MKTTLIKALSILVAAASTAAAEGWTLDHDASRLAFGSVKNAYIGEAHTFPGLSGSVSDAGEVAIEIALADVNTNIDIRNERMVEHVFGGVPTAALSATLDMAALEALAPGETKTMELDAALSFLGNDVSLFTEVFVARLSDSRVLVTTNDMLYLATDEIGVDAGIDTLQELAGLDSIARATPVTARFVFER